MIKKAIKPLIITAAVLVLLVAGYFLLRLIPDSATTDASPSPSATKGSTETYSLFSEDYYSLTRIEIERDDGAALGIDVDSSGDARVYVLSPAQPGWGYDQDSLRATAFNIIAVSALAKVAENVTDFSEYELDKPHLIARALFETDEGKVEHEIQFGKITTLQDSYYARLKNDTTVYAISKYVYQNLAMTELQYREMDFFPSYLSEDQLTVKAEGSVTYIRVRNEETGMDIEIRKRTDDELKELSVGSTQYVMTKPVQSDCNDTNVVDKLINVAAALKVTAVIEDNPPDLAAYGLDKPFDLWMTNTDGTEVHYLIGMVNGTSCYAMVEGTNTVLFAEMFNPGLKELKYVDFMFKLVWIHSIDDVKSIVFDMGGDGKRLLEIRKNAKDETGKVTEFEAALDGRPIEETNTRRLYSRMLDMMILGDLDTPYDQTGKSPDYTFTINKKDGTTSELRLFAMNERQLAASVNGADATFYINVSDVRDLEKAFEHVARGEEIPR